MTHPPSVVAEEETPSVFHQKLAARRAREAVAAEAKRLEEEDFSEFVPDDPYERSDADLELDRAVDSIDILDAYSRWCGKMKPKVGRGQRESIMISCPKPDHFDKIPSAWINLDKQTWFCGGCQEGGDTHDIAAYGLGYDVPGYKDGKTFHELRVRMAKDFGYTFHTAPGGVVYVEAPIIEEEEPERKPVVGPEPGIPPEAFEDEPVAPVVQIFDDSDIALDAPPALDWRVITPENTFLDTYMKCAVIDDVAEEYHFWNALLALGFALGRQARLHDLVPVYGNMFICTLGHSGSGKSKARYHLDSLLAAALPHDWTDPSSRGVRKMTSPGSAESLIHQFQKPVYDDPSNPRAVSYYAPVSGLIDFNELSSLIGRANRMGNVLKPTLMQFYDMEGTIETSSMSTGTKEAHEPFASALTTSQPMALRSLLGRSDDDSGFLNRWVFVAGPEKKRVAIGGVRVDMTPAVAPLQRILAWSSTFRDDEYVEWGPEAITKFTEFFDKVLYPAKQVAENALTTRVDLLMKKLILLLTANKMEKVVSGKTVEQVISMYDYIIDCYKIPEKQLGRTLGNEVSDAIMHLAQKRFAKDGKGITINDINRSLARRNYPHEMLLKHIDMLVKLEMLQVETAKMGTVGRPTTRYRYVG